MKNDEIISKLLNDKNYMEFPAVLLASAEAAPLSKTGGLADVVGTLPKSFRKMGIDARIITPYHRVIKEKYAQAVKHMFDFRIPYLGSDAYVGVEKLILDGVVIYLIDNESFFGDKIYRGGYDEGAQYAYFCRAVLEVLPILDFCPSVIHCNDWHTAMLPMLAKVQYAGRMQAGMKYLITIHNIAFQGKFGFPYVRELLGIDERFYTPEFMELYGCASFLKAGCVFADKINTVSPNYANEIKTSYYSEGLDGILNARSADVSGIINGIDTVVFNPKTDKLIPANYSKTHPDNKAVCKAELQSKLGLNVDPSVPLLAMVTRMTEQKGFALVERVIDELMLTSNIQFVLLGTGDSYFENFMRGAELRHKGRLCAYIGYNESLAHLVYAGSDLFLMPSRFEPCGLSQMIAMRYGSLPIVRETGGLKDTVTPYNEYTGEGTGFTFTNFDAYEMRDVIRFALRVWEDEKARSSLIKQAMSRDFGFENSAREYARLYMDMLPAARKTVIAAHESADPFYHCPIGSVRTNSPLSLSIKIIHGSVKAAEAVFSEAGKELAVFPMTASGDIYSVEIEGFEKPAALRYSFRITDEDNTVYWLCPDESGLTGIVCEYPNAGFRQTVYLDGFTTPDWFKHAVMYQIFPDRFGFDGNKKRIESAMKYKKELGQTPELHASLDEEVKWQPSEGETDYAPDDFYGGSLKGIEKKLPYLSSLGISCIYLNPIFEARSDNRYDTSDYTKIDPFLGDEKDFAELCAAAEKRGIKIILDGVFSHTGADSVYFNRFGGYDGRGAAQGVKSPYYSWYDFESFPDKYRCWWGFKDLPEVDEHNPEWQDFIIKSGDSVMKRWLEKGAAGWRLDVADELPDDVLSLMREEVKKYNPDAPIIGEVWEDAVEKVSYGVNRNYALGCSLDSVMNYPLRDNMLSFIHSRISAKQFADFLFTQYLTYPKPLYYSLMNLLGSHDTDRLRNALSTPVYLRSLSREDQMRIEFSEEALNKALEYERLAAAVQFSLPGVPSVYYGDEQGMCGVNDPFNRRPFKEQDKELHDFYKKLIKIRKGSEAFSTGMIKFFAGNNSVAILRYITGGTDVFGKPAKTAAFLTVVNRSGDEEQLNVDFEDLSIKTMTPLLGGGRSIKASSKIKSKPFSCEIYELK